MQQLTGTQVRRNDDDSAVPAVGVIIAPSPADPDYAWVAWLPTDADLPAVVIREALDELAPR